MERKAKGEGKILAALDACAPPRRLLVEMWSMGASPEELERLDPRDGESAIEWLDRALLGLGEIGRNLGKKASGRSWLAALWAPLAPLGAAAWMVRGLAAVDEFEEKEEEFWESEGHLWAQDALRFVGWVVNSLDLVFGDSLESGKKPGIFAAAGIAAALSALALLYPALAIAGGAIAPGLARERWRRRGKRAESLAREGLSALWGEGPERRRVSEGLRCLREGLAAASLGRWAKMSWALGWALCAKEHGRREARGPKEALRESLPGEWALSLLRGAIRGEISEREALRDPRIRARLRRLSAGSEAWAGISWGWARAQGMERLGAALFADPPGSEPSEESAARRLAGWAREAGEADGGGVGWEAKGLLMGWARLCFSPTEPLGRRIGMRPLEGAEAFARELGGLLPPGWGEQMGSRWARELGELDGPELELCLSAKAAEERRALEGAAGEEGLASAPRSRGL